MAIVKCEWLLLPNDKLRILTGCFDGGLRGWDAKNGEPVFVSIFGHITRDVQKAKFVSHISN